MKVRIGTFEICGQAIEITMKTTHIYLRLSQHMGKKLTAMYNEFLIKHADKSDQLCACLIAKKTAQVILCGYVIRAQTHFSTFYYVKSIEKMKSGT